MSARYEVRKPIGRRVGKFRTVLHVSNLNLAFEQASLHDGYVWDVKLNKEVSPPEMKNPVFGKRNPRYYVSVAGDIVFETDSKTLAVKKLNAIKGSRLWDSATRSFIPVKAKAKKNPAFGKRKVTHMAFKKKAPAKKFGRKKSGSGKMTITARKNPSLGERNASHYIIRGRHRDDVDYYFTGRGFDRSEKKAARYYSEQAAEGALRFVEDRLPAGIKFADVIQT